MEITSSKKASQTDSLVQIICLQNMLFIFEVWFYLSTVFVSLLAPSGGDFLSLAKHHPLFAQFVLAGKRKVEGFFRRKE